jgi:hypothetical protein
MEPDIPESLRQHRLSGSLSRPGRAMSKTARDPGNQRYVIKYTIKVIPRPQP